MKGGAKARPDGPSHARIAAIGVAALFAAASLVAWPPEALSRVRLAWFDACQRLAPREPISAPVTIVAIDEKSLARLGQWPWPRSALARLVRAIEQHDPAAIGVDILMPEADRLSPENLLSSARREDAMLASRLDALPSNDRLLAEAIGSAPVVLAQAGTPDPTPVAPIAPPFVVVDRSGATRATVADLPAFAGVVRNLDELDRSAAGHGVISAAPSEDVIRRLPLAVRVGEALAPSLVAEMLRVALGAADVRLYARGRAVDAVAIGQLAIPTERDGQVRLYYSASAANRYVSAVDVLDGAVDGERLRRKLALVSVTALATVDYQGTPLGVRMPGSEIHAQLAENVFDQTWLERPAWAPAVELATLALLGLALIGATVRRKPGHAALFALAAFAAFLRWRLLLDAALPSIALLLLFTVVLVFTLGESFRHRKALEQAIRRQREEAAYVAGELEAARRIQVGFLPPEGALGTEHRVEVAASMTPAREVGGDLYDYFMLDGNRLFFLIGDVAGKGLSASLFMAVSKALVKSLSLRNPRAAASELMKSANAEIARDNRESFFVTAFAGILDVDSGALDYCNAGHDDPYTIAADRSGYERLSEGAGPPLCAIDAFEYRSGSHRMRPGESLCLVTDGVVDARNAAGERYGSGRLGDVLSSHACAATNARALVDALCADVARFSGAAQAVDDVTMLVVRWNGPDRLSGR